MALNAYLQIKGQKSGIIKGSSVQRGRENKIIVIAASHELISPFDPQSGKPTGLRMHKPFVITKETDRSSPVLYAMFTNNEKIQEWELQFWAPSASGTGQEVQTYSVKLLDARIVSIHFHMPNTKDPEMLHYPEYEEIAFVYEKIIWTWNEGRIKPTSTDDWEVSVV